jgi:hypothetical protein
MSNLRKVAKLAAFVPLILILALAGGWPTHLCSAQKEVAPSSRFLRGWERNPRPQILNHAFLLTVRFKQDNLKQRYIICEIIPIFDNPSGWICSLFNSRPSPKTERSP